MTIASVNGIDLYYETHGSGAPLIMLHGGLGSVEMFGANVAAIAKHRKVIGVDLQAHGRTADIDRPMRYESMADDIAALIAHLGLGQADVLGYSFGGGVALQTAIRHHDRVRRLVVVSQAYAHDGWFSEVRAAFQHFSGKLAEMMKPSPVYQLYAKVAPRPQDFAVLLDKQGELMRQPYDWGDAIAGLPPTLLVAGDADALRPAHVAEFYAKLGGGQRDPGWDGSAGRSASQLAILPGATHYDIATNPLLPAVVEAFLAK